MAATNGVPVVEGPPLSLLIREKTRAYITQFPYEIGQEGKEDRLLPEVRDDPDFSHDGSLFVGVEGSDAKVVVRNATDGSTVSEFGGENDADTPLRVNYVKFSPLASHVLTWARPASGVSVPSLVLYETKTGSRVSAFHQKTWNKDYWPTVQWSDDETVAARAVTNTIHFFDGKAIGKGLVGKLHIPDVSSFVLSRGPAPYHVAVFASGGGGGPSRFALYQHPADGGAELFQRSTFRADAVSFRWSSTGLACIALVSTNVDSAGSNYYGTSEAYFIDVRAGTQKRIELPTEGPCYDIAWSPAGLEFIVIYGYMPARATLFNSKCEPVFDFGTGSRNTVSFSPHGRFVALAGFGNLNGGVEFWDKNKHALVGKTTLGCTTSYSWSPCSRYFIGATTFPRLRVDNSFRVVRFDGKLIHEHKMEESHLLEVRFRPSLRSAYQDPKLTATLMIGGPQLAPGEAATAASGEVKKKPTGAYRPPGARGTAASFSLHKQVEAGKVDKASFLSTPQVDLHSIDLRSTKKVIPGLDTEDATSDQPSKAARKRKKKKEKEQQALQQQESAAGNNGTTPATSGDTDKPPAPEELETVEAASKRAKALKKKLRQIDALKASVAEGKEINDEQKEKMNSGDAIQQELNLVEARLTQLSSAAE